MSKNKSQCAQERLCYIAVQLIYNTSLNSVLHKYTARKTASTREERQANTEKLLQCKAIFIDVIDSCSNKHNHVVRTHGLPIWTRGAWRFEFVQLTSHHLWAQIKYFNWECLKNSIKFTSCKHTQVAIWRLNFPFGNSSHVCNCHIVLWRHSRNYAYIFIIVVK